MQDSNVSNPDGLHVVIDACMVVWERRHLLRFANKCRDLATRVRCEEVDGEIPYGLVDEIAQTIDTTDSDVLELLAMGAEAATVPEPQDGVTFQIHGLSDDLVEVSGPCIDMGRPSIRGEYGAMGANKECFLIVDADLRVIARVYATYNEHGAWMFALAAPGSEDDPLPSGVCATTTTCDDVLYSTELTVNAPDGCFIATERDRRELARQKGIADLPN